MDLALTKKERAKNLKELADINYELPQKADKSVCLHHGRISGSYPTPLSPSSLSHSRAERSKVEAKCLNIYASASCSYRL